MWAGCLSLLRRAMRAAMGGGEDPAGWNAWPWSARGRWPSGIEYTGSADGMIGAGV